MNLSNEEYHASAGISKSQLDAIHISPLNYWDKYINPNREPQEDKHCFLIGSATHTIILEPDLFKKQYAIGFDKTLYPYALDTMDEMRAELVKRNLKVSGAKYELAGRLVEDGFDRDKLMLNLELAHRVNIGSRTVISAIDYKNMLGALNSLQNHHTANKLLSGALVENSFLAEDEFGFFRKCRPDAISANGQICMDVKSTNDVSAYGFGKSIANFRYHVQGAWYLDVLKLVMGNDAPKIFAFIPVQKNRPYDVSVQFLTEEQIQLGRFLYQKDFARLRECLASNSWPGADEGKVLECVIPNWEMKNLEEFQC